MGPTWGPPGAHRTQVGPMLATWTLLLRAFAPIGIKTQQTSTKCNKEGNVGNPSFHTKWTLIFYCIKQIKYFPLNVWCLNLYLVVDLLVIHSGVTMHSVMMQFILSYTACHTLHDTILDIHIFNTLFTQELSIGEDWRVRIHAEIGYCM